MQIFSYPSVLTYVLGAQKGVDPDEMQHYALFTASTNTHLGVSRIQRVNLLFYKCIIDTGKT